MDYSDGYLYVVVNKTQSFNDNLNFPFLHTGVYDCITAFASFVLLGSKKTVTRYTTTSPKSNLDRFLSHVPKMPRIQSETEGPICC